MYTNLKLANMTNSELKALANTYPYNTFAKYWGMDQTGQNDYVVGCIQTANAIMPVVAELALEAKNKPTLIKIISTGKVVYGVYDVSMIGFNTVDGFVNVGDYEIVK